MSTRKLVSVSVTRNGVTTKIPCTQEVADMLMSKEIGNIMWMLCFFDILITRMHIS